MMSRAPAASATDPVLRVARRDQAAHLVPDPPLAVVPPPRVPDRTAVLVAALLAVAHAAGLTAALVLVAGSAGGLPTSYVAGYAGLGLMLLGLARRPDQLAAPPGGEVRRLLTGGATLAVAGAALAAAVGLDLSPGELLLLVGVPTGTALVARLATDRVLRHRVAVPRVVVAGHRNRVARMLAELDRDSRDRFEVAAVCVPRAGAGFAVPEVAGFDRLPDAVREHRADAVIVLPCRHFDPATLRRLRWQLEPTRAPLFVASGLGEVGAARTAIRYAGELPFVQVRHAELQGFRRGLKAVLERLAAAAALVLVAPLLVALAIAIRWDSPGPALFRQVRVGRDGVPFQMTKLRTMSVDAEERRQDLTALVDGDGVLFKLRSDPRVTRLGAVLRRYSLDELPQLIHVVTGEMSLVGPRPALPDEVARYAADTYRRLAVRPGITGLWQVSGRSDLTWADTVRLDLRYVDDWSLGADLRILLRTVGVVARHRGAY